MVNFYMPSSSLLLALNGCEGLLDVGGQVVVMSAFNNIVAPTEYLHLKILPPFTAMFIVQVQFG